MAAFFAKKQPLATDYDKFLYKDTFHSCGQIWQCIALVIHQGPDPLNGEQQPCEHFYVLEHENTNSTILKYDNATGLGQLCISQLKQVIEFVVSFTDMQQFRAHGVTRDLLNELPLWRVAKSQNLPKTSLGSGK